MTMVIDPDARGTHVMLRRLPTVYTAVPLIEAMDPNTEASCGEGLMNVPGD